MNRSKSKSARRGVVTLPASILRAIDRLADQEETTRDELIVEAVKRFLKPHLAIRKQVKQAARKKEKTYGPFDTTAEMITSLKTELRKRPKMTKAISESTKDFKNWPLRRTMSTSTIGTNGSPLLRLCAGVRPGTARYRTECEAARTVSSPASAR